MTLEEIAYQAAQDALSFMLAPSVYAAGLAGQATRGALKAGGHAIGEGLGAFASGLGGGGPDDESPVPTMIGFGELLLMGLAVGGVVGGAVLVAKSLRRPGYY